jgi:surface protein
MSAQLPPSSLTSLTFGVSTSSLPNAISIEDEIPLGSLTAVPTGNNSYSCSYMLPPNSNTSSALLNAPVGTSFSHYINAFHVNGLSFVTTNSVQDYVIVPPPELVLDANNVTVKYIGDPLTSGPKLLYEDPRGNGYKEWFLVVDDSFISTITQYASTGSPSFIYPPQGQGQLITFNNIVTTLMTSMKNMFNGASAFNQPIESWDTSNVRDMAFMFFFASNFNQPIGLWNTGNVTGMTVMFYVASNFNQPIGLWDTSNVTNMDLMFYNCFSFSQDISIWNVAKVSPNPLPLFVLNSPLGYNPNPPQLPQLYDIYVPKFV